MWKGLFLRSMLGYKKNLDILYLNSTNMLF